MGYTLVEEQPQQAQQSRGAYTLLPDEPKSPATLNLVVNSANKGIAAIPDAILNTPNRLWNLGKAAVGTATTAFGRPDLAPDVTADPDFVANLMRKYGIIRADAEPVTATDRLIDAGVQGGVGALFSPANSLRQVAANVATGSGMGAVSDIVGEATGSPAAAITAGLVAPTAAAKTVAAARRVAPGNTAGRVLQQANGDAVPITDVVSRLRNADELVPGSTPMTQQVASSPGISQLARTVRNTIPGGGALTMRDQQQNAARISALDDIAPGAQGMTSAEAKTNAGRVFRDGVGSDRQAMKVQVNEAYNDPVLQGATISLPGQEAATKVIQRFYPGRSMGADPESASLASFAGRLDSGVPIPVQEFDALRKIAGNRQADLANDNRTASAAWGAIKNLFDTSETNALLNRKGLTPEQAAALTKARTLHQERVQRFDTGPGRNVWRTGSDGLPARNDAEVFNTYFNPGANQATDIGMFGRAAGQNQPVVDAFRKATIADLLERSINSNGNLGNNAYQNWTNARSAALPGLLDADQMGVLGAVGSDLRRAAQSESLGRAVGSNTAQNLEGSLLFSRPLSLAARAIPFVGREGLEALRNAQRLRTAKQVEGLLLDPVAAAKALEATRAPGLLGFPAPYATWMMANPFASGNGE